MEYGRYADDLVILVNGQWRNRWLLRAVDRRLREELAKLDLRVNETKSRIVDLTQGEAFGFLGFTFRRLRSPRGRWWVQKTPAIKQRTALLRRLREVFRRWHSQPVGAGDRGDQSNPAGLGELLPSRERGTVLWVREGVGREEGAAPSDASEESSGLRLEAVEYGADLPNARGLQRLPGEVPDPCLKARPAR